MCDELLRRFTSRNDGGARMTVFRCMPILIEENGYINKTPQNAGLCGDAKLLLLSYQNFHQGFFAGTAIAPAAGLASAFTAPVAWPVTLSFLVPFSN